LEEAEDADAEEDDAEAEEERAGDAEEHVAAEALEGGDGFLADVRDDEVAELEDELWERRGGRVGGAGTVGGVRHRGGVYGSVVAGRRGEVGVAVVSA
jgi:hypothetical protein